MNQQYNNNQPNTQQASGAGINLDYKKLLLDLLQYWWLFVITVPLALGVVYMMHRYVPVIYSAHMQILMEERGTDVPQSNMMEGFGLTPGMRSVDNQMALLTSWDMVNKAIHQLDFNVSYYAEGKVKNTELYPASTMEVLYDRKHSQLLNTPFFIEKINERSFKLIYTNRGQGKFNYATESFESTAVEKNSNEIVTDFGKWIETSDFRFIIKNGGGFNKEVRYYFTFNHPNALTNSFVSRLRAFKTGESSSIVRLSITGENQNKNIRFLNMLAQVFIESNLERKNQIATNTIDFIESQLSNIKDSLVTTGSQLSNFRTENKIQSISSKSEYLFSQLQEVEQRLTEITITQNYYAYLKAYFAQDSINDQIIAPAIYQVDNQLISSQIQQIMALNTERLAVKKPLGNTKNPYSGQMDNQLQLACHTLITTIENQSSVLKEQQQRIISEKRTLEKELYGLPETERRLLGIQRNFELNNEVYNFLLRKRSESQIQKASNTPDHQVLEAARGGGIISPTVKSNYQKALMLGLLLPIIFLVIRQLLDKRISSIEDITKLTQCPVVGQVLHSTSQEYNAVATNPRSVLTESLRRVRTRLDYMIGDVQSPVVTISSSIPGEGKTFCSLNLGAVFALSGKKTVLVGFDMRKPGLNKMLKLKGKLGTSEYLIGKASIDDIIVEDPSGLENFYIVPSGVNPPNPAELISSDKVDVLLSELKERFDIILIDSPPMGIVSDPYLLARKSDTLVFIARHYHSVKSIFLSTITQAQEEGIKNISVLLNDLDIHKRRNRIANRYGYGYGYGYGGYYADEK